MKHLLKSFKKGTDNLPKEVKNKNYSKEYNGKPYVYDEVLNAIREKDIKREELVKMGYSNATLAKVIKILVDENRIKKVVLQDSRGYRMGVVYSLINN